MAYDGDALQIFDEQRCAILRIFQQGNLDVLVTTTNRCGSKYRVDLGR